MLKISFKPHLLREIQENLCQIFLCQKAVFIFDNEIYEQLYGISAESLLVPFTVDASERVAIPSLF